MRVAITGAGGRLGSALVASLGAPEALGAFEIVTWTRSDFDLDAPETVAKRIEEDGPNLVIHSAAWTDVDGCAREPELAMRRNGEATAVLARRCVEGGAGLILISTNEVFDGERTDGRGYRPGDAVNPPNPYGRSKLAGEVGAAEAFAHAGPGSPSLGIVRTAWLFGLGKPDFPARIATIARAAAAEGRTLRLVADEIGTPTYVVDLARQIRALASGSFEGVHHLVNSGIASRAEWARDVLARLGIDVQIEEIKLRDYVRPSTPPRWGVLAPTTAPGGPLREWQSALADRLAAGIAS